MYQQPKRNWRFRIGTTAISLIAMASIGHSANQVDLRRTEENVIAVEVSNTDEVSGIQFTVNARGGIVLGQISSGLRAATAHLEVYQYRENDSTLNVIIITSTFSPLTAGSGTIGRLSFTSAPNGPNDTVRVFLSNLLVCNARAELVTMSSTRLEWIPQVSNGVASVAFRLGQNYPNPFNPSTIIAYTLSGSAHVRLAIYDITGREVRTLVDQDQSAGSYSVQWNALEHGSSALASGVYIARLQVGDRVASKKMLFAK